MWAGLLCHQEFDRVVTKNTFHLCAANGEYDTGHVSLAQGLEVGIAPPTAGRLRLSG